MELKFGTGGVRALMGEGENRMNDKTIEILSFAAAEYLKKKTKEGMVVICYDTRHNSKRFAQVTAGIFESEGCMVYLAKEPTPTPLLSYYIRKLKADLGINITASHNPKEYNGYKVYNSDGCQIGEKEALKIQEEIRNVPKDFSGKARNKNSSPNIQMIPNKLWEEYKKEMMTYTRNDSWKRKGLLVVYTPLHGTGAAFVPELLREIGIANLIWVEEQKAPRGDFPTCPIPNPEEKQAMELGLQYCRKYGADLLLATDPDSDRIGVAARDGKEYRLLTGNQVGILLLEYILKKKQQKGQLRKDSVLIKTIVTTTLADRIAASFGVSVIDTLTGFKYIGEKIKELEHMGRERDFIFGMEESCGYLIGTYARDKDALSAAMIICEMAEEERRMGGTLWDRLKRIEREYGSCENYLETRNYEEEEAKQFMKDLRKKIAYFPALEEGKKADFGERREADFEGRKIVKATDYKCGVDFLPRADVIRLWLSDKEQVTVRPSGTEPKIKFYREIWN